ncbi:unnamed protein product [Brassica oleracea]
MHSCLQAVYEEERLRWMKPGICYNPNEIISICSVSVSHNIPHKLLLHLL